MSMLFLEVDPRLGKGLTKRWENATVKPFPSPWRHTMKKTSVIKAGYRISCNSWENDGDNYNLTIKDGFSEPHARFIYDILSQFCSSDISNLYEPDEDEIEEFNNVMYAVFKRHECANEFFGIEDSSNHNAEQIADRILQTILHDFMGGSEYFTRTVEDIKVEYIPEDVIFEDRSENFKHVQKTFTNYR